MQIACVGGGPAGLYLSILMKRRDPSREVTVYERSPAGSTYGWGVTYWAGLLDRLQQGDPDTARAIRDRSVRWSDGVAHIHGGTTVHHGDEGFGIGRHALLDILTERAAGLGVRLEHRRAVTDRAELPGADLVVACDGVHSALRAPHADHFGTTVTGGRNRYLWLGTTRVFDAFTFAFVPTAHGWIWCYAYRYDSDRSTCVVECSPATWTGLGLDRAGPAECLALLEGLFAHVLDGHPLTSRPDGDRDGARWLTFRTVTNRRWHHGNLVLMGDAAHTTHYSIGAGTTLALEDALTLADALEDDGPLETALERYGRQRRSALVPAQSAARHSARWYEELPRYTALPPQEMFALLGQRHSPLLPYLPPRLYHRLDRAAGRLGPLRGLKRRLGPLLARTLHPR
ncbi:FAD-dependent monooxygenase [Streptomyces sp. ODS05-4]|uniref:FAD-dependent monooxygenase n=1 Tax=Streptomyces sp. ODS05-4 TaxID=2944939 RepID=UPI00210AA8B9|nr:FAD-dependent monooxygenase [Streptomyces sp. ODS05-4]